MIENGAMHWTAA